MDEYLIMPFAFLMLANLVLIITTSANTWRIQNIIASVILKRRKKKMDTQALQIYKDKKVKVFVFSYPTVLGQIAEIDERYIRVIDEKGKSSIINVRYIKGIAQIQG